MSNVPPKSGLSYQVQKKVGSTVFFKVLNVNFINVVYAYSVCLF